MIKRWIYSIILLAALIATGFGLSTWKHTMGKANEHAESYEPSEAVRASIAETRSFQPTTTAVGTVKAIQSIMLKNELSGTVKEVRLEAGSIVEPGDRLIALDVSVEKAEMKVHQANLTLAQSKLERYERVEKTRAASAIEIDKALAERNMIQGQIEGLEAVIARKTIVAPFKARVGLLDVHIGQYLNVGTELTSLQGVDEAVHVDFRVSQLFANQLQVGDVLSVLASADMEPLNGTIIALDSLVDSRTRNTSIRVLINDGQRLTPGSSAVVQVPTEARKDVVVVPASALRRSSLGDHVFVLSADESGALRAHIRSVEGTELNGEEVFVTVGLNAGELVATSGSFKLREGILVHVEESL